MSATCLSGGATADSHGLSRTPSRKQTRSSPGPQVTATQRHRLSELTVEVAEIGLSTAVMRTEVPVSSPEPAVGVFTPAGTCPGRLRRHFVIGYADPGQNPPAVRFGSSRVRGRGLGRTKPGTGLAGGLWKVRTSQGAKGCR